jgi:AcrR family transcriptional regulator
MGHQVNKVYADAKRVAILEAALAEFGDAGFAGGSMRRVAERANIAKGTLYLYFTDKAELFAAALDYGWELFIAETEAVLVGGGTELERLGRVLDLGLERLRIVQPLLKGMLFEGNRRGLVSAKVEKLCGTIQKAFAGIRLRGLTAEEGTAFLRLVITGALFEFSSAPPGRQGEAERRVRTEVQAVMEAILDRGRER